MCWSTSTCSAWAGGLCFLINIPLGGIGLALAARAIPESTAPQAKRLDLVGAATLITVLVLVLIALTEGPNRGWPGWCWLLMIVS